VNTRISAIEHLRPLRGGAQSHLLRASDGNCYVTKFQNNPQHIRVLANEMLATRLGLVLGLPMPKVEVIEVSDWLIANTPDLRIQLAGRETSCQSGRQLGSLYMGTDDSVECIDYLPRELLERVRNIPNFARVLVLDKWTCNCDGRQAIFFRKTSKSWRYTTTYRWLKPGGVLLFVIPQLRLTKCARLLSEQFTDLRVFRLTAPSCLQYKQMALLATRRKRHSRLPDAALLDAVRYLETQGARGDLEPLGDKPTVRYEVPSSGPVVLTNTGNPWTRWKTCCQNRPHTVKRAASSSPNSETFGAGHSRPCMAGMSACYARRECSMECSAKARTATLPTGAR